MLTHKLAITTLFTSFLLVSYYTTKRFSSVIPIANFEITMDRAEAIKKATEYHQLLAPNQTDYLTEVAFIEDIVEENKEALEKLMRDNIVYYPFYWQVRHFTPLTNDQIIIRFTATGQFYGFQKRIPDNRVVKETVSKEEALNLIKTFASNHGFPLEKYEKTSYAFGNPNDTWYRFLFVYPNVNSELASRIKIIADVSGNEITTFSLSGLSHYDFSRHFANKPLEVALSCIALLYVIGGMLGGLLFLYRNSIILWKQSYFGALFISVGTGLAQWNRYYPNITQLDLNSPLWKMIIFALLLSALLIIIGSLVFAIVIAAAEGLSRKAFPHHLQLWSFTKKEVATSTLFISFIVSGYALAFILFLAVLTFLFCARQWLGWLIEPKVFTDISPTFFTHWIPSTINVRVPFSFDPHIFVHYAPWFSPFVLSLQIGFMEECFFRAIPLAGAALIGKHFGKRKFFIFIAFIIQVLLCSTTHIFHYVDPFYPRIIGLAIPSIFFGLTYLWYGLIPTIIAHITYDIIWLSLPLFVAPGFFAHVNQFMIIMCTLIPVWFILIRRYQQETCISDRTRQPLTKINGINRAIE